jgi:hypothetical protein
MNKIVYNVVGSTIKVTASSKLDVSKDLEKEDPKDKNTIAELLDEQEKENNK